MCVCVLYIVVCDDIFIVHQPIVVRFHSQCHQDMSHFVHGLNQIIRILAAPLLKCVTEFDFSHTCWTIQHTPTHTNTDTCLHTRSSSSELGNGLIGEILLISKWLWNYPSNKLESKHFSLINAIFRRIDGLKFLAGFTRIWGNFSVSFPA